MNNQSISTWVSLYIPPTAQPAATSLTGMTGHPSDPPLNDGDLDESDRPGESAEPLAYMVGEGPHAAPVAPAAELSHAACLASTLMPLKGLSDFLPTAGGMWHRHMYKLAHHETICKSWRLWHRRARQ